MFILIILLIAGAMILLSVAIFPFAIETLEKWRIKKEKVIEKEMDKLFYYDKSPKEIVRLYFILPPLFSILGALFLKSLLFFVIGVLLGLFIPNLILKIRNAARRQKFNNQIVDAIMIISSSLKGGLSILQAMEVLAEESAVPMSQEIGLVIRENKMGITLEDALVRLNKRMGMEDLNLVVNSILVARETGGDLTKVLSRVATTIRDNRKLKDSVATLTLQGKLQGLIMSGLPFLFIGWVLTFNRQHFDIMFHTQTGRTLLFAIVILQTIGMILIRRFSTIRL